MAFVGNELDSTVTVLRFAAPAEGGAEPPAEQACPSLAAEDATAPAVAPAVAPVSAHDPASPLRHLQTLSSLPAEAQGKSIITPQGIWRAASHSSELRLRPDGRFLYVGNRGHDSIAVFAVLEGDGVPAAEQGTLRLAAITPCGGACPRNFGFTPDGAFLVVGNQNSSTLVSFAVDAATGALTPRHSLPLPSPNYVYSLRH